jgi:hypothetical protein
VMASWRKSVIRSSHLFYWTQMNADKKRKLPKVRNA